MSTVLTTHKRPAALTLPSEVLYVRYLAAITTGIAPDDHLLHSIHTLDHGGTQLPWTPFDDVERTAGEAGSMVDAAITFGLKNPGGIFGTHVVAVDGSGGLRRTFRLRGSDTWEGWEDVKAKAGSNPGDFARVAIGSIFNDLHVCGLTADGLLWHTMRHDDGTWEPFFDIGSAAGDLVDPIQLGCRFYARGAGVDGLQLFVVTGDGRVWSTARRQSDGTWSPFIDIRRPGRAGNPGRFVDIDCFQQNRELHITGVTDDGRLWYAIRREDSTWKKMFTDVEATAGDKGTFVSATVGSGEVVGATSDGGLWWTFYDSSLDKFAPFRDVAGEAGRMGVFTRLALHSTRLEG